MLVVLSQSLLRCLGYLRGGDNRADRIARRYVLTRILGVRLRHLVAGPVAHRRPGDPGADRVAVRTQVGMALCRMTTMHPTYKSPRPLPAPAVSLQTRAEHPWPDLDPDAPLQELAEAVQQRLALIEGLDEGALREIPSLGPVDLPPPTYRREEPARCIAAVPRKVELPPPSAQGPAEPGPARDLPVRPDAPAGEILRALRSGESFRQRFRRKRAWVASLIGKVVGQPAASLPAAVPAPSPPNLKEQIVEPRGSFAAWPPPSAA